MSPLHDHFMHAVAVAALSASLAIVVVRAATPEDGTLAKRNQTVTWSGGPFTAGVPNQLGCLGPDDPTCDTFRLTVGTRSGSRFAIAITAALETDDYDLYVYYPDGAQAAVSATGSGNESVVIEHTTSHGPGPYIVKVLPFAVGSGSTYSGIARSSRDTPTDGDPTACLEATPDAVAVDTGNPISLDVAVLLDGIDRTLGQSIMARAAASYAPLNIGLRVVSYRTVSFSGTEGAAQIQQAKDFYGGGRPAQSDIVYVLTNKDITSGGDTGLAGLADCIGGVRFNTRAFAVGEAVGIDPFSVGPFIFEVDAHAEIAAHEIGHLMGGHHHYANCVEGTLSGEPRDVSPCTLMFNFVDFQSLNFSVVNSAVVRGHAVNYAAP